MENYALEKDIIGFFFKITKKLKYKGDKRVFKNVNTYVG